MKISLRLALESAVLVSTLTIGIMLGSQHPITGLGKEHAVQHLVSTMWLFYGNTAITLAMLFCSVLTGGFAGLLTLFANAFTFGTVFFMYSQSPWVAIFPWMEFIALIIAIQIGADIFWALLLKWRIYPKLAIALGGASLILLLLAAFIEGGILNV